MCPAAPPPEAACAAGQSHSTHDTVISPVPTRARSGTAPGNTTTPGAAPPWHDWNTRTNCQARAFATRRCLPATTEHETHAEGAAGPQATRPVRSAPCGPRARSPMPSRMRRPCGHRPAGAPGRGSHVPGKAPPHHGAFYLRCLRINCLDPAGEPLDAGRLSATERELTIKHRSPSSGRCDGLFQCRISSDHGQRCGLPLDAARDRTGWALHRLDVGHQVRGCSAECP
jgi:hypothetical protein